MSKVWNSGGGSKFRIWDVSDGMEVDVVQGKILRQGLAIHVMLLEFILGPTIAMR